MTTTIIVIATVAGILAGIAGAILVFRLIQRFIQLESKIKELQEQDARRRQMLDEALKRSRPHHSYNTLAALEDAMSLLIQEQMDDELRRARLETALGILQQVRKGPHNYTSQKDGGG